MQCRWPVLLSLVLLLGVSSTVSAAKPPVRNAGDVPGDFGDAPEGGHAYFDWFPVIAHFPSCVAPTPPGTREASLCPAISTAPGMTGFIKHVPSRLGRRYWLGCGDVGIDTEPDAKNAAHDPAESCGLEVGDCDLDLYAWSTLRQFEQDECIDDGEDSGLQNQNLNSYYSGCANNQLSYRVYNEGEACAVYLNVLVDQNRDGDWNDQVACNGGPGCGFEWAVKNATVTLAPGCSSQLTPSFPIGIYAANPFLPAWIRITLTDDPVDDDFPWKGSAGLQDDAYSGGETEDYAADFSVPDAAAPTSWGKLKLLYR